MFSVFVMYRDEYEEMNQTEQQYLQQMIAELQKAGKGILWNAGVDIPCRSVDNCQGNPAGLLIMTCHRVRYEYWKKKGAAVFGYICPAVGDTCFPDSPIVVEGFAEVDVRFLERIYQRCHHLPWEIARTRRLVIRETVPSDLPVFEAMYQEPEAKRFLEPLYAKNAEDRLVYIQGLNRQYAFYGYGMWTVERTEHGHREIIGRAGIEIPEEKPEVLKQREGTWGSLGYLIGEEYRGCGYGYEACQAILQVAGEELGFDGLYCRIREGNTASFALAGKLGLPVMQEKHCNLTKHYL